MKAIKYVITLSLFGILFLSCKQIGSETKKEANEKKSVLSEKKTISVEKLATANFTIEGMTCAIGCAKTIEKELSETDGVQKATVDFDKKEAIVSFDATKQTPEKLVKLVEATGDGKTYKVSNLK